MYTIVSRNRGLIVFGAAIRWFRITRLTTDSIAAAQPMNMQCFLFPSFVQPAQFSELISYTARPPFSHPTVSRYPCQNGVTLRLSSDLQFIFRRKLLIRDEKISSTWQSDTIIIHNRLRGKIVLYLNFLFRLLDLISSKRSFANYFLQLSLKWKLLVFIIFHLKGS